MTHAEVIGAVQHTAVCVAAAVDHIAVAFSCSSVHDRTVKLLCNQSFRCFRTEVAEEDNKSIAVGSLNVFNCSQSIFFVFYCDRALIKIFTISCYNILAALCGELDRETVTGYGNNTNLDLRDVIHINSS